jgi:hypothetical protein
MARLSGQAQPEIARASVATTGRAEVGYGDTSRYGLRVMGSG